MLLKTGSWFDSWRRLLRLRLLVLLALVNAVAACGGGGSSGQAVTTTTTTGSGSPGLCVFNALATCTGSETGGCISGGIAQAWKNIICGTGGGGLALTPPNGPKLVATALVEAREVATSVGRDGSGLFDSGGQQVNELIASYARTARSGVVSDGNARLLIRAFTDLPAVVTAEIEGNTSSTIESLLGKSARNGKATTAATETLPGNGGHVVTFILRAGYDYHGSLGSQKHAFSVFLCPLTGNGSCSDNTRIQVIEHRPPIVLLHGLWSTDASFVTGDAGLLNPLPSTGLRQALIQRGHFPALYSFDENAGGHNGPSTTMRPDDPRLAELITRACVAVESLSGAVCTKAILIGHSMGGLVARKYIADNRFYSSPDNFGQGSVAKLLTLGTPHLGSPLADALLGLLPCNKRVTLDDTQPNVVLIAILDLLKKQLGTAIQDLRPNGPLIQQLKASRLQVPTHAVVSNVGPNNMSLTNIDFINDTARRYVLVNLGCSTQDIYGGEFTDGIVPESSAAAGYKAVTRLEPRFKVLHVGMGSAPSLSEIVLNLLEQRTADNWDMP